MKIQEIVAPSVPNPGGTTATPQLNAREKAIRAFMNPATPSQAEAQRAAPQAQETPVKNPTSISPEEFTAVQSKYKAAVDESKVQNYQDESTKSTEVAAESKTSEEPLSSQYAILARKEKAIRQREQQLRAKEAALRQQETAKPVEPPKPALDETKYVSKDRLTQDPFTVLTELGLTYDQLTEMALNGPRPEQIVMTNQIRALEQKLAEMEGKTKKTFEEQEALQRQQTLNQFNREVDLLVRSDADSFELINAHGKSAKQEVVKLIEKTFDEDGYLMSVEEAARLVEDHLADRALKLAKAKKIQQRLAPKPAPEAPEAKKETAQPEKSQLKTLTNSVGTSRQLSARERALLAFEGKLSK